MSQEKEVLERLSVIIDPDLGKDIVALGFIKNLKIAGGTVSFVIELTTPACPVKEQFRQAATEALMPLPWVEKVEVEMGSRPGRNPLASRAAGLERVRQILAVGSCKGGVGKSTVAVNLAFTLAGMNAKVGIFDADVYGPSLPTMVDAGDEGLYQRGDLIIPYEYEGLKLMSFAYASPEGRAAVMRGPMVTQIINQLLTGTDWGELDYLVIDMPPGTGDIQLTLSQLVPITAAVMVTTPQQLSFVDVVKGIEMFDKLKIPTVAVVENMSYFVCPDCDSKHYLFGQGARQRLIDQYGIRSALEIPIDSSVARCGDGGRPVVLEQPDGPVAALYRQLAADTVREISKVVHGQDARPTVSHQPGGPIVYTAADGSSYELNPAELRRRCKCAHCIDEMTGAQRLKPSDVADDVAPTQMQTMGNYAITIDWSDGHGSIYPYEALAELGAAAADA